jgi:5S rRNA maturation endonuclease (ribonuclease M5)
MCNGTNAIEARRWIKKQTGTAVQDLVALLAYFDEIYSPTKNTTPPLPKLHTRVLEPWLALHPYLTEIRGCLAEVLRSYWVGYDPATNRIVVPHFWRGNLVGWQTRRLLNDGTPKWKSSIDFPKAHSLFSYDEGKEVVVVEAPLSVLRHAHHVPMEATFGATVSDYQIRLLAAHPKVTLFFDNDRAGWKATRRVGEALMPYAKVYVAANPYAADPADMDDALVEQVIRDAEPFSIWEEPRELVAL